MHIDSKDLTLERNAISRYLKLISEYDLIKEKRHPTLRFVKDFYRLHGIPEQIFLKYHARFKQSGSPADLLPQKRGAKYKSRRIDVDIEQKVVEIRARGLNKYEIHGILQAELLERTPSVSCIYKIFKRNGMNVLKLPEIREKQRYIREKAGDLAHVDCHYLKKGLIDGDQTRYYLISVVDDQSRVAWCEFIENIKALTVMFATLRCFNQIRHHYGVNFKEVLTDNGSEFGPKESQSKEDHPFERLLIELGVKHRHTKPYRPQTNGKVERFWRTINDDLIDGTFFESKENFKDELEKYIIYYNSIRPHQALNGLQPDKAIVK